MSTTTETAEPRRRVTLWQRLPVVHQLRQSVGLQRGMLVAGLLERSGRAGQDRVSTSTNRR